jgi:hypothetical protein
MPTKKNGASRIDRLEAIVETLAASVVAHDNQIEAIIHQTAANSKAIDRLEANAAKQQERLDRVVREWQAYLRRLPPQ